MISMLSYPKSGGTLTRYIIEYLTKRGTLGCRTNKLDTELYKRKCTQFLSHDYGEPIAEKWHKIDEIQGDKLIMLLRHPMEAFLSFHEQFYEEQLINSQDFIIKSKYWMLRNLEYYSSFQKPKCLSIYENLIFQNHELYIRKIASFFQLTDNKRLEEFLQNFDIYREDCRHMHTLEKGWGSNTPNYYRSQLSKLEKSFVFNLMQEVLNHPLIIKIYGDTHE